MTEDQFNQVVNAILDGKYSWACVLILRFTGYNPLHYIPYRTYNRLLKENTVANSSPRQHQHASEAYPAALQDCLNRLEDLGYLESLNEQPIEIQGGNWAVCGDRSTRSPKNLPDWHWYRTFADYH